MEKRQKQRPNSKEAEGHNSTSKMEQQHSSNNPKIEHQKYLEEHGMDENQVASQVRNDEAHNRNRMDEQPSHQENEEDWESDNSEEMSQEIQYDEEELNDDMEEEAEMDSDSEQLGAYREVKIKKINIQILPKEVRQIYDQIDSEKPLRKYITIPKSQKIDKEVCAKVITSKDTVIECFDCRMDETCIICMECFKNGNHEGHRFVVKKAGGGCCDCGDPQAWNQKGFCKNHSGKFKDFEIPQKTVSNFSRIIDGLMYLYFQFIINQDPHTQNYTTRLIKFMTELNQENTYFNKLTALCLVKPLSQSYSLNEQLDNRTILQNILTSHISLKYFKHWFDLFISMFSYYPFKMDILKHYIQNYGLIVDGSKYSTGNALSISCQIVTSYKVVQQYCHENSIGIGQGNPAPTKARNLLKYYQMLCHDINSFCSLADKTPLAYWRMHINSPQSIKNLFQFYDILLKKAKIYQHKKTQTQLIARYIDFSQVQFRIVDDFTNILRVIHTQRKLLEKIVHLLWNKCLKLSKQNPQTLCILRPYQRCLTLALFNYFQCSFSNIAKQKQKLIKQVIKTNEPGFTAGCFSILNRMLTTLFFYSKTQAQPGLGQTVYAYTYMYKTYSKLLSMADLLSIKLFIYLLGTRHPLTFESVIGLDRNKLQGQEYLKQKQNYFINIVKVIRYLYTHFVPEIYLTYSIHKNQLSLYQKQIKQLFISFFKENKNSVSQVDLRKNFVDNLFPPQCKIVDSWIKQNCIINKQTKSYKLGEQILNSAQNILGINYDDLWISTSSKNPFSDIPKSLYFISGYNVDIFNVLWNQITLQSLNSVIQILFNKETSKEVLASILPDLITIYLVNKIKKLQGNFENIFKLLESYSSKIPVDTLTLLEFTHDFNNKKLENQKKQRMNELKAKKLQKLKQKQQNFLQSQQVNIIKGQQMQQQKMLQKFKSQQKIQQQLQEQKCCVICRKQLNETSVYIINLSIRNHQKLLKIGQGIQCISINSCKHVLDYKCIQKMYKKSSNVNSVSCPLCKFQGNMLFPASKNCVQSISSQIADRVIQILNSISENADFYQEIIKGFYHYALLCCINFEFVVKKKSELYQTLLFILKGSIPKNEILKIRKKLETGTISKQFEKELKEEKNISHGSPLALLLNLLRNQNVQQAVQNQLIAAFQKQQSIQQPKQFTKQKRPKQQESKSDNSLFKEVISVFLDFLSEKQIKNEDKQIKSQQNQMINQKQQNRQRFFAQECLKSLIQQKYTPSKKLDLLNGQKAAVLKKMPQKYTSIGSVKKCSQCNEISVELIMCLLCDWQGCQKCEKGYAITHINRVHGEVGAVMQIQKGIAYYMTSSKPILAGNLYEDEWQNRLQKNTNWDEFELNIKLYKQMELKILNDDIPTRSAKQSNQTR